MEPEEYSVLNLYGNKEVFEKRFKGGYTEISFGVGKWLGETFMGDDRIVAIWAFFHPDGRVATYEHPKQRDHTGHTLRGKPFESEYNIKKRLFGIFPYISKPFEAYIKEKKIRLEQRTSLVEIINKWNE